MSTTAVMTPPVKRAKPAAIDTSDVLIALVEGEMLLDDLLAATSSASVAMSWMRGEIEFGRRSRVVTGNPNIRITREGESPSRFVVEDGIDWTGPKTTSHSPLAGVIASNAIGKFEHYRKYESAKNDQGETYMKPVAIERDEAVKLCAMKVRLTNKGQEALSADAA